MAAKDVKDVQERKAVKPAPVKNVKLEELLVRQEELLLVMVRNLAEALKIVKLAEQHARPGKQPRKVSLIEKQEGELHSQELVWAEKFLKCKVMEPNLLGRILTFEFETQKNNV